MNGNYLHIIGEDKPLFVLGDLHGYIDILKRNIIQYNISDCSIVVAGDIGIGFLSRQYHINEYQNLNDFVKKYNITLYLVRGNHDDPKYFNRNIDENDDFMLSHVKVVPDYTVLTVNNKNILLIGGAVSIDREYRKKTDNRTINELKPFYQNHTLEQIKEFVLPSYWADEMPYLDTEALDKLTADGLMISHIITHTCPSFAYPTTKDGIKYWLQFDSKLNFDIDKERAIMDNIYQYLLDKGHQIEEWVYGHYHNHNQEIINNVKLTLLYNIDRTFDLHEICRTDIFINKDY